MTYQRKTGLGRGLSALLNDDDVPQEKRNDEIPPISLGNINNVKLSQVEVNPFQPRTEFDKDALNDLAESISVQGLIQPITVRRKSANTYQLISGERRLRACKLAGLTEIPAYIRSANDQQMLEMALIENIQRENLNAIEVALSFQRMLDECNIKQEELGGRVGKNRSTVTNYLRLLKLPPQIQISLRDNKLSMGHARALINIDDVDVQLAIHQAILNNGLSVRSVEQLVRDSQKARNDKDKKSTSAKTMPFQYIKIQDDLTSKFRSEVKLKVQPKGQGAIEIPFSSNEDLNRILELLDW